MHRTEAGMIDQTSLPVKLSFTFGSTDIALSWPLSTTFIHYFRILRPLSPVIA